MNENQLQQLLQTINTLQDLGKVAYFNKGAYNSETTYEINDVITYQGSSYVSLNNNNQGNLPTNTTYWSIVALKGDKGDTGKPFVIEKTYSSVEDMVADYDNMNINDYVMISGNIEEEQNATLWTKTETPAPTYKWVYLADFSGASGITGQTPNIQIGNVTEGNEPAVTRRQGSSNENPILDFVLKTGATGATGATGNGISSVSKTGTSGLTDTYTIAYTNGNNTTFDVNNGKGIVSIAKTGTSGLVDTYTITYNDGTTSTFTITNGEDGEVTQAQLDEVQAELDRYKTLANVLPKTTGEGTEVTLNNCGASLLKMQPKGNTEQDSYEGNQLVDFSNLTNSSAKTTNSFINNVLTVSSSSEIYTNAYYDITNLLTNNAGKTLKFVYENIDVSNQYNDTVGMVITYTDGTSTVYPTLLTHDLNNTPYIIPNDTSNINYARLRILPNNSNTSREASVTITKPMLQFGTESKTYEPFVGGSPSPSPDYPQDVKVVTGNNTIKQTGKNLFDGSYENIFLNIRCDKSKVDNGFKITANGTQGAVYVAIKIPNINNLLGKTVTLSMNATGSLTPILKLYYNQGYSLPSQYGETMNVNGSNTITLPTSLPSGIETIAICFYVSSGNNLSSTDYATFTNIQLELGSSATTYVPYVAPQTYSLNLGSIELCKKEDYQDYIYKDNGKWYKHSEIGKVVLDGSEVGWGISETNTNTFRIVNSTILSSDMAYSYDKTYVKNNYFELYSGNTAIGNIDSEGLSIRDDKKGITIRILKSRVTDLNGFKTWLASNNVDTYYVLATPTDEEITDTTLISQLNAINDTLSFDGQTNISSEYTSGNAPVIISAEAIAKFSS